MIIKRTTLYLALVAVYGVLMPLVVYLLWSAL
jgi:hypothetical protein